MRNNRSALRSLTALLLGALIIDTLGVIAASCAVYSFTGQSIFRGPLQLHTVDWIAATAVSAAGS
jgi:hypothetical protein